MQLKKISLVVPILNEEDSIGDLIKSVKDQTLQPDEIILVDGGSTDKTISIIEKLSRDSDSILLIRSEGKASPGRGRNIGVENAKNEWIAFTDAGIRLEKDWLELLAKEIENDSELDIVYGDYSPISDTFFEKCAAITHVSPLRKNSIRGRTIVSSLFKKKVWKEVGGFPDLRAAEDLMFMEAAEKSGFNIGFAPKAKVHWQLRPNLSTTFSKFVSYSKHNVLADRQHTWHYGIVKQYLLVLPFILLSFYSNWFLLFILIWLVARTFKRIFPHRYEFGLGILFNPLIFFSVAFLVLVIDLATFMGWIKAKL